VFLNILYNKLMYDKIIKSLTNIDNKLDYKFISKDKVTKINKNIKPYTYHCIEENIKIMKTGKELLDRYYSKKNITKEMNENMIFIKDGFARGVSKYINRFHPQKYDISNAYVKLWEMYSTFHWLIEKKDINCFHMAEAPGQWINTTYNFISNKFKDSSKYEWLANSLNPEHPKVKAIVNAFSDDYGFIRNNKDKWLYSDDNSGDITNAKNIKWLGEYVHDKFDKINLVTGDAGIITDVKDFSFLQKIEIAQAILVAHTATIGSNCVIKHFLPFIPSRDESKYSTGFHMSMMYLYYCMFEEFHMFKPLASAKSTGEYYVVCRNFKGLSDLILSDLLDYLDNFNANMPLFMQEDIPKDFSNKVCEFVNKLMKINIDVMLVKIELLKCINKIDSKINCKYYFGKDFKKKKYKEVRQYIKHFNIIKI
jgi:hypothetical protein